jgi:hypothetical protein
MFHLLEAILHYHLLYILGRETLYHKERIQFNPGSVLYGSYWALLLFSVVKEATHSFHAAESLLTADSRAASQKEFSAFYETRRFITVFVTARHRSLVS